MANNNQKLPDGPGKGKEKSIEDPQDANSSLGGRILDSAKGLINDATRASRQDASQTLNSSSVLGSKSGFSTSTSRDTNTGGPSHDIRSSAQPSSLLGTRPQSNTETFRSHATTTYSADQDFEHFLTSSHDTNFPTEYQHQSALERGLDTQTKAPSHLEATLSSQTPQPLHTQPPSHSYNDGAAVIALLANPSFTLETGDPPDPHAFTHATAPEPSADDLFPQAADDRHREFRESLPAPPTHAPMPASHPLNLQPRSEVEQALIADGIEGILTHGSLSGLSTMVNDEDQSAWLGEWRSVLSSYADEVWGEMLPEVRVARREVEEAIARGERLDGRAVARLRMIVGHLRGAPGLA